MINWQPGEIITSTHTSNTTGALETNKWEVIKKGRIKVLQCDPHFASYLNIGKEYDLVPGRKYEATRFI